MCVKDRERRSVCEYAAVCLRKKVSEKTEIDMCRGHFLIHIVGFNEYNLSAGLEHTEELS